MLKIVSYKYKKNFPINFNIGTIKFIMYHSKKKVKTAPEKKDITQSTFSDQNIINKAIETILSK